MSAKRKTSASGLSGRLANAVAKGAGVIACVVLLSSAASAATFVLSPVLPADDFPNPLATSSTPTIFENTTGTIGGVRRSPWEGTTNPTGLYSAVLAGASATYDLGVEYTQLSIMWGSVDTFNTLEFLNGGSVVDSLVGSALIGAGAPEAIGFTVALITAAAFDAIRFSSTQNAFEYANLAAVPIPPALPLFATGLAALVYLRRRSRRRATAVAA